jgi:bifunctional dethiobiotin synthetase / adenosylmethionine---8-amino-7-oxononanoate aminotransferase
VDAIILFEDSTYGNLEYLQTYFMKRNIHTIGIPQPPERSRDSQEDFEKLAEYYRRTGSSNSISELLHHLESKHNDRVLELESMAERATKSIWWPFQQHQGRTAKDITAIESAYGDYFDALNPETSLSSKEMQQPESILQPALDGSASWWTQGLGHGNPELALSAAYAAGRYGHVMFANAIHKPALDLAQNLLRMHDNPRLAKVFFTDNGSTGVEVAVKMALKASCQRYGWNHADEDIVVLGLTGSYHGDTMGAMDCSEPSIYNKKVAWYHPRGVWLDFPQVKMHNGKWVVEMPAEMGGKLQTQEFASLGDVFNLEARADLLDPYSSYIAGRLEQLQAEGTKIGALLMEPVILGAGGMLMPDPLFQHALIQTIRQHPELIHPDTTAAPTATDSKEWSGAPVIFDEVFTGIYRLGRFNTSSFLNAYPDIVVNAKLLTGGLVPLCTTTASDDIFSAFLSDEKAEALLHGHSYTAHAIGCNVANKSLATMEKMEKDGKWDVYKDSWRGSAKKERGPSVQDNVKEAKLRTVWSMWGPEFVTGISKLQRVEHVVTLGSVLAIALKDDAGSSGKSLSSFGRTRFEGLTAWLVC